MTLTDLPLKRLRRILRDTQRVVGPDAESVRLIRRAIQIRKAWLAARRGGTHAS